MAELWCVALIGARASGKSTLARALAHRTSWPHCDSDDLLAAQVGCPAGDYLESAGEEQFRVTEEEVNLDALRPGAPRILALGGGAVLSVPVREALSQEGVLVVFLDAPVAVLVERQRRSTRPALTDLDLEEEVAALLDSRRSLYERLAHLRLGSQRANVDACCEAILAKMEEH